MADFASSTGLIPPQGDPKVGRAVWSGLEEIIDDKEHTLSLPQKWMNCAKIVRSRHFGSGNDDVVKVDVNLIRPHLQNDANQLCANSPTFNVRKVSTEEGLDDAVSAIQQQTEYWWHTNEVEYTRRVAVLTGGERGCVAWKLAYNPDAESGDGEVEVILPDTHHVGFLPVDCKNPNKDAKAWYHFYPMSIHDARRMWPDKADVIKTDDDFEANLGEHLRKVHSNLADRSTPDTDEVTSYGGSFKTLINKVVGSRNRGGKDDKVTICEVWVKDYSTDTVTESQVERVVDEETGAITESEVEVQIERPKYYGNIRCITVCNGGAVVLDDRNNPSINPVVVEELGEETMRRCYLWDKFPFGLTPHNIDPQNPWGMSDIEFLAGIQREIEIELSNMATESHDAARNVIKNPVGSGVGNEQFFNDTRIINPSNPMVSDSITYMHNPNPAYDHAGIINLYQAIFPSLTNSYSWDQSSAQAGKKDVLAAKGIALMQEMVAVALQEKEANYAKMTRDWGRMYVSLMQNWYTDPRLLTWENEGQEEVKEIIGPDLIIPVKLMVVSGSTLPKSKIHQREEALALYQQGAIDLEALHERLETEDRAQLIARMKEGPSQEMANRTADLGAPEILAQWIAQLGGIPENEFEKAVKEGKIPPFEEIHSAIMGEPEPPDWESEKKRWEAEREKMEAAKIEKELALLEEKIVSERVNQHKVAAGVEFDAQKLRNEDARLIAELRGQVREAEQPVSFQSNRPGYNEQGLESNNVEE